MTINTDAGVEAVRLRHGLAARLVLHDADVVAARRAAAAPKPLVPSRERNSRRSRCWPGGWKYTKRPQEEELHRE